MLFFCFFSPSKMTMLSGYPSLLVCTKLPIMIAWCSKIFLTISPIGCFQLVAFTNSVPGVPIVAQWRWIQLGAWGCRFDTWPHSVGWESGIAMSCGVGNRHGLDLALLWLWCRLAAVALIWPLAWQPPRALGAALKRGKKKSVVIWSSNPTPVHLSGQNCDSKRYMPHYVHSSTLFTIAKTWKQPRYPLMNE